MDNKTTRVLCNNPIIERNPINSRLIFSLARAGYARVIIYDELFEVDWFRTIENIHAIRGVGDNGIRLIYDWAKQVGAYPREKTIEDAPFITVQSQGLELIDAIYHLTNSINKLIEILDERKE